MVYSPIQLKWECIAKLDFVYKRVMRHIKEQNNRIIEREIYG